MKQDIENIINEFDTDLKVKFGIEAPVKEFADEVLKVVVEKIKNYKPHIGEDGLLRRKGLLDYLSPKENKNNEK